MTPENKLLTVKKQARQMTIKSNVGSPTGLIERAIESGADLEKLGKLLELQQKWEAGEARKAFNKAVSMFKSNPPKITKDKQNSQYKSMYTTLGNLVNTVNPELSKHGLSTSWSIKQNGIIEVTCILKHELGHSESASASAAADTSGSKNAIQQIKSTITYLKAVTFESVTGLASTDANVDDDGESHGVECIDEDQKNQIFDMMADKSVDEVKFTAWLKIESIEKMPKSKYQQAIAALEAKKAKASK